MDTLCYFFKSGRLTLYSSLPRGFRGKNIVINLHYRAINPLRLLSNILLYVFLLYVFQTFHYLM